MGGGEEEQLENKCLSTFGILLSFNQRMSKRQKTTFSDEPIVQRMHVGGLAPSVTPRELVARFSSFGEIKGGAEGVQGLGVGPSGKATLSLVRFGYS